MEPQMPIGRAAEPTPHKGKGKCILAAVIASIVFAGGTSAGVNYYVAMQNQNTMTATDSQIQGLQNQINDLKEMATWQTYTNATYGFSFKYPAGWTVTEKKASYGDARQYEISFGDKGYYVTVFNIGSQTANAFVQSYYGGVESGPSDIKGVTINNNAVVKFFMQHASTSDQTVGSTNYFFSKNSTGVDVSNSMKAKDAEDTVLTKIADSFTFQ